MKNENCLAGIKCPKCEHTESFKIRAYVWIEVEDEGVDPMMPKQDIEWDEENLIDCQECGHVGKLGGFQHQSTEGSLEERRDSTHSDALEGQDEDHNENDAERKAMAESLVCDDLINIKQMAEQDDDSYLLTILRHGLQGYHDMPLEELKTLAEGRHLTVEEGSTP